MRRNPLTPSHRRQLAITKTNLALALARTGDQAGSDAEFDEAVETLRQLIADFPDQPSYQSGLAALLNNRGVALRASGRSEEALEVFAEAVRRQEFVVANATRNPARLALLGKQYGNYADALREAGDDRPTRRDRIQATTAERVTAGQPAHTQQRPGARRQATGRQSHEANPQQNPRTTPTPRRPSPACRSVRAPCPAQRGWNRRRGLRWLGLRWRCPAVR